MDRLQQFRFKIDFKVPDPSLVPLVLRLLGIELKNLEGLEGRITGLVTSPEGKDGIAIELRANDMSSFKIAASSINKCIEIIGKVLAIIHENQGVENVLNEGS